VESGQCSVGKIPGSINFWIYFPQIYIGTSGNQTSYKKAHPVKEFFNAPYILSALLKFTMLLVRLMVCLFIATGKVIIHEENAQNFKGS